MIQLTQRLSKHVWSTYYLRGTMPEGMEWYPRHQQPNMNGAARPPSHSTAEEISQKWYKGEQRFCPEYDILKFKYATWSGPCI